MALHRATSRQRESPFAISEKSVVTVPNACLDNAGEGTFAIIVYIARGNERQIYLLPDSGSASSCDFLEPVEDDYHD